MFVNDYSYNFFFENQFENSDFFKILFITILIINFKKQHNHIRIGLFI